jgi:hypothetical protein
MHDLNNSGFLSSDGVVRCFLGAWPYSFCWLLMHTFCQVVLGLTLPLSKGAVHNSDLWVFLVLSELYTAH